MGDPESSVWRAVTAQHWLPVLRAEARTPGFHAPSHDSPGAGPSLENAASVVQESLFPWDTVHKAPVSLPGSGAPSSEITLGPVPVPPRDPRRRPGSPLLQVSRSVLLFLAQTTSTLSVPRQASEGSGLVLESSRCRERNPFLVYTCIHTHTHTTHSHTVPPTHIHTPTHNTHTHTPSTQACAHLAARTHTHTRPPPLPEAVAESIPTEAGALCGQGCSGHLEAQPEELLPPARPLSPSLPTAGLTRETSSSRRFAGRTRRYTATSGTPAAQGSRSISAARSTMRMTAHPPGAGEGSIARGLSWHQGHSPQAGEWWSGGRSFRPEGWDSSAQSLDWVSRTAPASRSHQGGLSWR